MPRELLTVRDFSKGLVSNVDPRDIPDGACRHIGSSKSYNMEPAAEFGKLMPRKGDTIVATEVQYTCRQNVLIKDANAAGADFLVYHDGAVQGSLRVNENFPSGTSCDSQKASGLGEINSIVVHNREARAAANSGNKWVGRIDHKPDWDGAVPGVVAEETNLDWSTISLSIINDVGDANGGELTNGVAYRYAVVLEFDGYQYSVPSTFKGYSGGRTCDDKGNIKVDIKFWDITTKWKDRITAALVFRVEGHWSEDIFILAKRIVMSDTGWYEDGGSSDDWRYSFYDRGEEDGQTYEQITGLPQTLDSNWVTHKLGAMVGSYYIAANCTVTGLTVDDATHMIFRSLANRPDMFYWAQDYLRLPFIPLALANFGGRLWAFDEHRVARINVESMVIEDILVGVGVSNNDAVLVNEFGMFIADRKQPYWHDGQALIPIGSAIANEWQSWANATTHVAFHRPTRSVLFLTYTVGIAYEMYLFQIESKSWHLWKSTVSTSYNVRMITGEDGVLYLPTGQPDEPGPPLLKLSKLGEDATRVTVWLWNSKIFDFDTPSQIKKIYTIEPEYTGTTLTMHFATDGGTSWTAIGSMFPIPTPSEQMCFKITGSTNLEVLSFDVLFRRMVGIR